MIKLRIESIMSSAVANNKEQRHIHESLENLEIGTFYPEFHMIEDHIDDYNVELAELQTGDIIVKDFQFGYRPHGNDKGYIPVEVVEPFDGNSLVIDNNEYQYQIWVDDMCDWETFHKLKKSSFK